VSAHHIGLRWSNALEIVLAFDAYAALLRWEGDEVEAVDGYRYDPVHRKWDTVVHIDDHGFVLQPVAPPAR